MALRMTATVTSNGILSGAIQARAANLVKQVKAAEKAAAATATKTSQAKFKRVRPVGPSRAGRSGNGQMSQLMRWRPLASGGVGFNYAEMNQKAEHWIIQEIGTGQRATVKVGGAPRPVGRPQKGATYVRTVKSQKGRRITSGLVFATGPTGTYSRPGQSRGQQLYYRANVKGVPFAKTNMRSQPGIIIGKEIEGQHMVRDGAREGFREYRASVLAAARTQFRKSRA